MSFGAELFLGLSENLSRNWLPSRIGRIETGDSWAAFRLTRWGSWLLFSWDSRNYGCGMVQDEGISFLKKNRDFRSSFGEMLKSSFQNGSFLSVSQENRDRVLLFRAERIVGAGFPVKLSLVFEGMDRNSNLIVVSEAGTILEPAKHIHSDVNRYRTILPGFPYVPPPPVKGVEWASSPKLEGPEDGRKILGMGRGLASLIAENWESRSPSAWKESLDGLFGSSPGNGGLLLQKKGDYVTLFPMLLPGTTPLPGDIASGCGEVLVSSLLAGRKERILSRVRKAIEKEVRSRERHADGLRHHLDLAEKGEAYRRSGRLILASLGSIPARAREVSLADWETGETVSICLDERLSAVENAERYFRKFKKGKVDREDLQRQVESLEAGIVELSEQLEFLQGLDDPDLFAAAAYDVLEWLEPRRPEKGRKKKEPAPPHIRVPFQGSEILVGLNARGNRHVTFRSASPGDLWFHVHDYPGAHVVVKSSGGECTEETVAVAASLAAWFSRAKNMGRVWVDYTEKKNVRSVPGSAISLVTYSRPRTIQVSPRQWKEFPEAALSGALEDRK